MKTVLIMSTVTFVIIFGGIAYTSGMLEDAIKTVSMANVQPEKNEINRVLSGLESERNRLEIDKAAIESQWRDLKVQQKFLAEEEIKLEAILESIVVASNELISTKDKNSAKLAKVYESMKPDKAAPILSTLDIAVAVEILGNMKERQAAKIMSFMPTETAASISSIMSLKGEQG